LIFFQFVVLFLNFIEFLKNTAKKALKIFWREKFTNSNRAGVKASGFGCVAF